MVTAAVPATPVHLDPLGAALDGSDPLSQLVSQQSIDPLSAMAAVCSTELCLNQKLHQLVYKL